MFKRETLTRLSPIDKVRLAVAAASLSVLALLASGCAPDSDYAELAKSDNRTIASSMGYFDPETLPASDTADFEVVETALVLADKGRFTEALDEVDTATINPAGLIDPDTARDIVEERTAEVIARDVSAYSDEEIAEFVVSSIDSQGLFNQFTALGTITGSSGSY